MKLKFVYSLSLYIDIDRYIGNIYINYTQIIFTRSVSTMNFLVYAKYCTSTENVAVTGHSAFKGFKI